LLGWRWPFGLSHTFGNKGGAAAMIETFGNFIESKGQNLEYLKISFSPLSGPLQQCWRNNGLSADFLADYLSTFFPGHDNQARTKQAELKDAVSYVANELLENAMKYNFAPVQHAVSITMELHVHEVRFYVTNCMNPKLLQPFQDFLRRILREDPDHLYMEQLTRNEQEGHEDTSGSGLGFLTMLINYQAELAWKFEPIEPGSPIPLVTTSVRLPV
jgi:hypothetical protein